MVMREPKPEMFQNALYNMGKFNKGDNPHLSLAFGTDKPLAALEFPDRRNRRTSKMVYHLNHADIQGAAFGTHITEVHHPALASRAGVHLVNE